jgi:stearoyl-CoA desaturase (delta-9 desaturase)
VSPWGILIGGEELHNNHHTYPTSAKLSVKPYEFDIGWLYISILQTVGLAKVRKTPPMMKLGAAKAVADGQTLEAIIANRYEVMAKYAANLRAACAAEIERLNAEGQAGAGRLAQLKLARRWLHRDENKIPADVRPQLLQVMENSPRLSKLVAMREELRQLWTRTNVSAEQLLADLQDWCRKAEESGIVALQEFSFKLKAARIA